ncbi:MAG: nucleotidyltransferase substrate binding protein [Planctomycetes bacterium]|nr:nucleotidyltransferase substrate binding protein [Planctomycetota bacterium]
MLELTSLRKAIDSLSESLKWYHKSSSDIPADILRDSAIQRFEYTYELSWKMMKRWLEINLGGTYVDGISRRELFRYAAEHRLIKDSTEWFSFHEARNQTSHVYDETVAEDVFRVIDDFVKNAECLYQEISKHND